MANEFTARVAGISVELGMSVQNKSGIWCKPTVRMELMIDGGTNPQQREAIIKQAFDEVCDNIEKTISEFTKGSLLDEKYKEVSSGYANPCGNLVSVKVEKNKVTKNDRRLQTYTLNYSTGVDEIKDTLDLAIMLGIISQAGAWYKATLKDGKEQKMQGFNGVQEFYYNDLEELEYLRKQVYEAGMA